nr:Dihydrofolate reductase [uncultured bacterium]
MTISIIVAVSRNNVIGKEGDLPWRLPADLAHFKKITMGHPILMGQVTYDSIGRPLPGRKNIVITKDKNFKAEGCKIAYSINEALSLAKGFDEVFIIGGDSIYKQTIDLADKLYVTQVHAHVDGDRTFVFDKKKWRKVSSITHKVDANNALEFDWQEWVRK